MNLFREINARGTTVVVATHDRELIRRVGRRVDHPRSRPHRRGRLRCARCATRSTKRRQPLARAPVGLLSTATIALALFVLGGFLLVTVEPRAARRRVEPRGRDVGLSERRCRRADERRPSKRAAGAGRRSWRRTSSCRRPRRWRASSRPLATWRRRDRRRSATIRCRRRTKCVCSRRRGAGAGVDALAARLRQMPGVADVRYDRQWLDAPAVGDRHRPRRRTVLGGVLTLAAALTVANVVRLALYARRDEIEIMQLVGAPQAYIRGPFVMEGRAPGRHRRAGGAGGAGSGVPGAAGRYLSPLAAAMNLSSVSFLPVGAVRAARRAAGWPSAASAAWSRRGTGRESTLQ